MEGQPPNPADLIESQRINQFIEEAKDEYDMIPDTAPILLRQDPAILEQSGWRAPGLSNNHGAEGLLKKSPSLHRLKPMSSASS
jgi:hypothetical protein